MPKNKLINIPQTMLYHNTEKRGNKGRVKGGVALFSYVSFDVAYKKTGASKSLVCNTKKRICG